MIIVAILKHVAGKSADYGAALDYLKYEHDEILKKPLLDANGNWVLRRDILLEGINCEPELFDVECEMLNAQYHKNQNYDEIKTHHYLISFDPADKDECGLTGEQAQAIGMEYVKANFPGHQALVCTHMDGHNSSGNIHVHIVINSLRKLDVQQQPFMERPIDCKAGYSYEDLKKARDELSVKMSDARNTAKSTDADLKMLNEKIHYLGQYLSTKATYKEFLQAGNKKMYRSAHQDEIARYEEAVQFLKRNSTDSTIPTMKDLRAEKEKLLSARTAQYESYTYFKDYYHELQTACRNVDMILETEHTQQHSHTQPKRSHEPSL